MLGSMGKVKKGEMDTLQEQRKLDLKSFLVLSVLALCGIAALIVSLNVLSRSYEKDIETGSASHLVEINHQVKSTIEKVIDNDRKQAETMKLYIESDDGKDADSLYAYSDDQLQIWNYQEIYFFNANGICFNSRGVVQSDVSSTEFAAEILRNSSSYRINKSQLEYGVSVTSNTEIDHARIVAVSIANDLNSLLDDMKITSFNSAGAFYLTQQNGIKISQTHSDNTTNTYNVLSLLSNDTLTELSKNGTSITDTMNNASEGVYLYAKQSAPSYIIMSPLNSFNNEVWYLFYIIPSVSVNQYVNEFSGSVIRAALLDIGMLVLLIIGFFVIYQKRINRYNASLVKRDNELREMLVIADSANKAKTDFLSNVSHDIRTPLNAIINMTEFAKKDIDSPQKLSRYLEIIRVSSDHLLHLINDVLDMSRIESGRLKLEKQSFNLTSDLDSVSQIIRPMCDKKNQTMLCRFDRIEHKDLHGDVLHLNQVLINLLNNASKFTPEHGQIVFTVTELESLRPDTATYRFSIKDNGIGIKPEDQASIFEPFVRGHDPRANATEGTGLGLAITKNIVQAMGGNIHLISEPGKGSEFIVELYFDQSQEAQEAIAEQDEDMALHFDGRRALVVEDNEINLMISEMLLQSWGFTVEHAINGEDAVSMVQQSALNYYDIIYMDIQMPVIDGYEAARQIRQLDRSDVKDLPIIAMTANVFADDVEKARAAGMNAHVGKPIVPSGLHAVTREQLHMTSVSNINNA
jgi:signal transduction histidine kinase/ActR/RegA family two-component response regulator